MLLTQRRAGLSRTPLLAAFGVLSCVGCVGSEAPSDPYDLGTKPSVGGNAGAGGSLPQLEPGTRDSHFPLVDGASWTYHHTSPLAAPWDETDTLTASTYQGEDAFVLSDEEDGQGEQTHSTHLVDGTRVVRAYKEVEVRDVVAITTTYDPPFVRYNEAWTKSGDTETLDDDWVQYCVVASTASNCAPGATKLGTTTHTYTVLDVAAQLKVPAGTFTTVKVQRDNVTSPETKFFWFAAGVGKVREENPGSGAVTELASYEIP